MRPVTSPFWLWCAFLSMVSRTWKGGVVHERGVGEAVDLDFSIRPCVPSPNLSSSAVSWSAILLYSDTVNKVLSIRLSEIPQDTNAASPKGTIAF